MAIVQIEPFDLMTSNPMRLMRVGRYLDITDDFLF